MERIKIILLPLTFAICLMAGCVSEPRNILIATPEYAATININSDTRSISIIREKDSTCVYVNSDKQACMINNPIHSK